MSPKPLSSPAFRLGQSAIGSRKAGKLASVKIGRRVLIDSNLGLATRECVRSIAASFSRLGWRQNPGCLRVCRYLSGENFLQEDFWITSHNREPAVAASIANVLSVTREKSYSPLFVTSMKTPARRRCLSQSPSR